MADTWDDLDKQFGKPAAAGSDSWESLDAQFRAPQKPMTHETPKPVKKSGVAMTSPNGLASDMWNAGGRSVRDFIDGPAYVVPKGLGFLTGAGGLAPNPVSDFFNKEAERVSGINKKAEADYQAATPGSVTAGTIRAFGNIAPFVLSGGTNQATKVPGYVETMTKGGAAGGLLGTRTEDDSFLGNVALGAGLTGGLKAVGQGLRSLITPSGANNQRLLGVLEQNGVKPNAAQASDSGFLKSIDAALEMLPFTASKQRAFKDAQVQALTEAVAKKAGTSGPLTPDVMGAARQAAGRAVGDITRQYDMPPNEVQALLARLNGLKTNEFAMAASDTKAALDRAIAEVSSKVDPTGKIPGDAYRALDSFLGKQKVSGDPANAIGAVRGAARDSMFASAPQSFADALAKAKQQYQTVMTIAPLAAKNPEGMINPQGLLGAVRSGVKNADFGARPDLMELGQAARLIAPHRNSGTAPLSNAIDTLQGGGLFKALENTPLGLTAGGLLGIPVQALMNSPLGLSMARNGLGGLPVVGKGMRAAQPAITGLLQNGSGAMLTNPAYDYLFSRAQ